MSPQIKLLEDIYSIECAKRGLCLQDLYDSVSKSETTKRIIKGIEERNNLEQATRCYSQILVTASSPFMLIAMTLTICKLGANPEAAIEAAKMVADAKDKIETLCDRLMSILSN